MCDGVRCVALMCVGVLWCVCRRFDVDVHCIALLWFALLCCALMCLVRVCLALLSLAITERTDLAGLTEGIGRVCLRCSVVRCFALMCYRSRCVAVPWFASLCAVFAPIN